MKKINLLLVAAVGALAFSVTSCTDPCKDVVCENGGTCDEEGLCVCPDDYYGETCAVYCVNGTYDATDGTCTCDDGYEGDACDVEERTKFLGDWSYTTTCAPGVSDPSTISTVADNVLRVTMTNLTGFNDNTAYAIVDGETIMVPAQSVVDGDGDTWQVESNTATIVNDAFEITVTLTYGTSETVCPYNYSK